MGSAEARDIAQGSSLLVVDDEPAVLKITKRLLERHGHRVVACASAEEALDCLEREAFDVVLSDVQMPGIGGLVLLQTVRERKLSVPVILVTGNPSVSTATAAVESGVFQYLIKPVAGDHLEEVVTRAANWGKLARADASLTAEAPESLLDSMGTSAVSLLEALRLAKEGAHVLWLEEAQAPQFQEPGWEELQPHRNGAVMFINRGSRPPVEAPNGPGPERGSNPGK